MRRLDDPLLMRALMDAAVDAVVISDAKGRILGANRAAGAMFQRNASDMTGKSIDTLMPEAMARRHRGFMDVHMTTGEQRILDSSRAVQGVRADGSTLPILLSVGRADTELGAVFVSIMRDLSEQRALEEAAERSQRMDAIGRMTGGISHDFNNLLTVIIGNLELMENSELTERQRRQLRDALGAAELGADLTSRLMAFARKSALSLAPMNPNVELQKAVALLRHTIGSHIRIELTEDPNVWTVAGDATQLQTAILNLAMNSQDAMPNGGVLAFETHNIEVDDSYLAQEIDVAPGRYVRFSVSDDGHGMTEEERARALEPFFTTKPAGVGTGLGLSVVYGYVRQLGGYLTIYSEPGDGTVVALYFPVVDDHSTASAPGTAPKKDHAAVVGRRVLIVEDNSDLRTLTAERFAALGYVCETATTADEAWEKLSADAGFDLVFTDIVMPGKMSGADLLHRVGLELPDIPVLLTSGFSESVLTDRRIGANHRILRKPYRLSDLEEAALSALGPPSGEPPDGDGR